MVSIYWKTIKNKGKSKKNDKSGDLPSGPIDLMLYETV